MIFRIEHMKRERREAFAGGSGGGYCLHALSPQERIPQSRFQQASRIELDPGSVVGEHVHRNNEELYWIVSGMGVFTDDGIEAPAKPGDLLLTLRGHRHGLRNIGSEPLVFLAVIAGDPNEQK
jgi:mannose-6-phosphate isomerase-like protein (cupin superfamily)